MPINIYKEKTAEKIAWLSEGAWDLPTQLDDLENWLLNEGKDLPADKYIADIGFRVREYAAGGGGVLLTSSMKILSKKGIDVYFSEYS